MAVILSFALAAFISWTVSLALGELASMHPAAGSFGVYGDLYFDDWAGFISRAGYWAAIAVSIGAEMVASATYMRFWFPAVPAIAWVLLFSLFLLATNLLSVHSYGRFEFWFAMIKVAVIAVFIAASSALLFSGRAAQHYTTHGGIFASVRFPDPWAPSLERKTQSVELSDLIRERSRAGIGKLRSGCSVLVVSALPS